MLELLGIKYYDSDSEAETLCAYLCCHGMADMVLSEDTDVLVYGTPTFITKLNIKNEIVMELKYEEIVNGLELEPFQFTDLCIMCGTDYNDNIPQIGSEKAYKIITKHSNLDLLEKEREDLDLNILNFRRIREIFTVPENIPDYETKNTSPQLEDFMTFASFNRLHINDERLRIIKNMVS
jgi:5'-3' exonuclease